MAEASITRCRVRSLHRSGATCRCSRTSHAENVMDSTQRRPQQVRRAQDMPRSVGWRSGEELGHNHLQPVTPQTAAAAPGRQLGRTLRSVNNLRIFTSCCSSISNWSRRFAPHSRGEPTDDVARSAAYYITGKLLRVLERSRTGRAAVRGCLYKNPRSLRENKQFQDLATAEASSDGGNWRS